MWAALSFGSGVLCAHLVSPPSQFHLLLIGSGCLLWIALAQSLRGSGGGRSAVAISLLLAAAVGGVRYQAVTHLLPVDHVDRVGLFGAEVVIRGRVAEEPERREGKNRFALSLETQGVAGGMGDGKEQVVSGKVLVTLVHGLAAELGYGDRLTLRGRLLRPQPARNPSAFDYRQFLAVRDIHATISVRRPEQILRIEPRLGRSVYTEVVLRIRNSIRRGFQADMSGARGGLLQGLLLGEKYRIPQEVQDSFRTTGLAHALVISGLHVGLVTVFFFTGLKLCRLPDRPASAMTVAVLVLYAFVTELQPPVVRATIMATAVLVGRMAGRQGEVYNSLGLAALVILSLWPADLLSLSFQLSFAATLAIVGLHGPISSLFPKFWRGEDTWTGKWLVSPLCVSIAAQIGTAPLIAYHFQQFAPISLIANLAVVPLLGLVVGLGILTALTGWWIPLVSTAFNASNYLVLTLLIEIVEGFAAVPWASVSAPRPSPELMALAAALTVLLAHLRHRLWARRLFVCLLLGGLNTWVWGGRVVGERQLEVVFLDVGQGDAAFLQFPNGKTMIIDAGTRSSRFDNGARVVVPFLRHRNVWRVDVVVATHPHSDHIGGLVALLEQVEVAHFADSGQVYDSWTAQRLRELIRERGITYHRLAAGDSLAGLGGVGALVLHPNTDFVDAEGGSLHDLNNGSVVIRFTYGQTSLLFTGDIEEEADTFVVAWGERRRAQILKVAHHGSRTSSRPLFVEWADPEIALISVGPRNKFGHPAPEVVARYQRRGVQVYRTDHCGAVIFTVDTEGYEIEAMVETDPEGCPAPAAIR
jgi:competence protein ComEC